MSAEELGLDSPRKRPVWVWIIAIWTVIGVLVDALSLYLVLSGKFPLSPAGQAYFAGTTPLDLAYTALIGMCNVGGAVSLFLLRKVALPLYIAGFALNVTFTAWQIAFRNVLAVSGVVPLGLGLLLSLAIVLYVAHLSKKGILA